MEPFKNLFSPELVGVLADHLEALIPTFERTTFEGPILADLESLELKARAQLIADHVHVALPDDHVERVRILTAMLHPDQEDHVDAKSDADGICGWGVMPLSMVVGQHDLEHFDSSLALLREMTTRSSSEFAVRYFLLADQPRAIAIMGPWANDPNLHVRRLVSEGTRPRLPWAMQLPQLIEDPSPMLPILESLRDDPEEYVRRSVANHLNDIAKDHPDVVANLAREWMQDADKNRERLVRHACRTLIKQGHPEALAAFGLGPPKLELESLDITTPAVAFGTKLDFSAELRSLSDAPQPLVVDYLVHFLKANGSTSAKVFKWTKLTLAPGESRVLSRSHPIRPITTRRYYSGVQRLSLRINGRDFGDAEFELTGAE